MQYTSEATKPFRISAYVDMFKVIIHVYFVDKNASYVDNITNIEACVGKQRQVFDLFSTGTVFSKQFMSFRFLRQCISYDDWW